MIQRRPSFFNSAFVCDARGATAIEFAIVASVFFMVMFAIIEYGLFMFTKVAIESATMQASRTIGVGTPSSNCLDTVQKAKQLIAQKTSGLIRSESAVITSTVVSEPTSGTPPVPDICLDNAGIPYPPSCTRWVENGGNPDTYDPDAVISIGNAGDLVEIRVTYLWRVLFPIFRSHIGENGVLTITTTTVVKNEPSDEPQCQ